MPYIREEFRGIVDSVTPLNPGELNYAFTVLLISYLEGQIRDHHPLDYRLLNDVAGAFELAKAEFVRRAVNPYEDKKIAENGDVYPPTIAGPRRIR